MNRALFTVVLIAASQMCFPAQDALASSPHASSSFPHQVQISATRLPAGSTAMDIGPTLWSMQGFDLQTLLARVYGIDPKRIEMQTPEQPAARSVSFVGSSASAAQAPRFDISLQLSGDESDAAIQQLLRSALEARFHISARLETRAMDVYELTAPQGAGPGLRPHLASSQGERQAGDADDQADEPMEITIEAQVCPDKASGAIHARAATLEGVADALEATLDRPIVDETRLNGTYDFRLPEYHTREQLLGLLQSNLGLSLQPRHRDVTVLAVRPSANLDNRAGL